MCRPQVTDQKHATFHSQAAICTPRLLIPMAEKCQLHSLSKSQKQTTTTQFPKWISLIKRRRSCSLECRRLDLCSFAQQHSTLWMYFSKEGRKDPAIFGVSRRSPCVALFLRSPFFVALSDKISLKPYLAPRSLARSGFIFGAAPSICYPVHKELGAQRITKPLGAELNTERKENRPSVWKTRESWSLAAIKHETEHSREFVHFKSQPLLHSSLCLGICGVNFRQRCGKVWVNRSLSGVITVCVVRIQGQIVVLRPPEQFYFPTKLVGQFYQTLEMKKYCDMRYH